MSTPILRSLAKAYTENLIDRKEYIHERRQLIDGIVSGELEIVPYETLFEPKEPAMDRTFSDGGLTMEIPRPEAETPVAAAPATSKTSNRGTLIAFGIVGLLAILAAVVWLLSDSTTPPGPSALTAQMPNTSDPATALLENLLNENQWDDAQLNAFARSWNAQSTNTRLELSDSPVMRRAADAIAQRITEEQALYELGAERDALSAQKRLFDLADTLSISNERISRLANDWQHNNDTLATQLAASANPVAAEETPARLSENNEPSALAAPIEQDTVGDPPTTPALAQSDSEADTAAALAAPHDVDEVQSETGQVPQTSAAKVEEPAIPSEVAPSPPPEQAAVVAGEADPVAPSPRADPATANAPAQSSTAVDDANVRKKRKSGCRASLAKTRKPRCSDVLGDALKGPSLVVLPAGSAQLGGAKPEEQPSYGVSIKNPFALSVYEISFEEFKRYCDDAKSACPAQPWSDAKLPVVNVTWNQAREYTQWLSEKSGATYRLPSEAEWEYAARAGTQSTTPFGDELLPTHARFSYRGVETSPLPRTDKTVNRNKFRLYHMLGNVREWVLDAWHGNHSGAPSDGSARTGSTEQRVVRGGAYSDGAEQVRSASRLAMAAGASDDKTGFRVLREVD